MAADYAILATNRTVEVRSPTLVEDVMEVHAQTKPSGVTFTRAIPYSTWKAGNAGASLAIIAQHIEHIFASRPHVVSGAAVQQLGQNGLLSNGVEFVVSYDSTDGSGRGPFSDTVTIPVQALHDDDTFDRYFDPVVKRLAAEAAA